MTQSEEAIKKAKHDAREIKDQLGIKLSSAYEILAQKRGFRNWDTMLAHLKDLVDQV